MLEVYSHITKIQYKSIECPVISYLPCGIDIGYSAIKVKSPHNFSIIPSLVKKVDRDVPLLIADDDIRYKDENNHIWYIGSLAKKTLKSGSTALKKSTLLGRQRIQSEEFLIQIRVALFFARLKGLEKDKYLIDNRPLKIQTGLPPEFMKQDSGIIKDRFEGEHHFSIKLGKHDWIKVHLKVKAGDVYVCKQPFGTLMSCVMNNQGKIVNSSLLNKNLLVLDPGFHSVDTFHCMQGATEGESLTWENLGMQEVFQRTCNDIFKSTNHYADIDVYTLEKNLKNGFIYFGPKKEKYDFENGFMKNLQDVCIELLGCLNAAYDNMIDIDEIILTGGTGAAWGKIIQEQYRDMGGIDIIMANEENIVSANVEGYYNLLISRLI